MTAMISENFDVRELVHPDIYNHPAIGDRCIDFLHVNLAPTLESLKLNLQDVITVNNWMWGGGRINSGLRDWHSPKGANYSSHYQGTAVDAVFKLHSAAEVYAHILGNQDLYPYITRMEHLSLTPDWIHLEVGKQRFGKIYIIKNG